MMVSSKEKQLEEWVIEVDQDVYDEMSKICAANGTTIEKVTESFIRFCADPANLPVVERLIDDYKSKS